MHMYILLKNRNVARTHTYTIYTHPQGSTATATAAAAMDAAVVRRSGLQHFCLGVACRAGALCPDAHD